MICTAPSCSKPIKQQNLCGMHAQRLWRHGSFENPKGKYHTINKTKDTRKGKRGYVEANTIDDIRCHAKKRGKEWKLSAETAFKLITSNCIYCGFKPDWPNSRVGIDRINNLIGYVEDNCVSCCFTCNSAKGTKSIEEFKAWITTIYKNLIDKI